MRRLFIDPSATKFTLGRANLTIDPLSRRNDNYTGPYSVKVAPFTFKSEKGMLFISVPDEALRKLYDGVAADFTGRAVTTGTGETRQITARATPADGTKGAVTFSFPSSGGKIVFNTSYHFAE